MTDDPERGFEKDASTDDLDDLNGPDDHDCSDPVGTTSV